MNSIPFTIHPDAFIHDCLTSLTHLIPGISAAFYLVDSHLTPTQHLLSGIDPQTHQDYLQSFLPIDPLHPRRFNHLPIVLAALGESGRTTDFYRRFMQPNGIHDMVEVYIRQRKRIVAGLSLMRDRTFTLAERLKLRASLPLLELATEELIPCDPQCRLTPKEQQIVEMVREGSCNKRIALRLDISLSTVKTHLRNIFAKTNANSRTELLSCLGMACDRDYLM
ncbi:helix-turn-helix transcriptional regulator [Pantoea coffeiphila]|uniref:Helix-turn-helix transcriptional regulator n=2 Tax=Pantoea coffeiphila TaxID=1465635 RepID=A0A2S9IFJ6_9GAMM|nr:helix-turn-helix transcriptional regulator [Pantoea coffeiphila]PRD16560.1 helix-turn-helix transcriptional regulator [Pantoea coffeiphila]